MTFIRKAGQHDIPLIHGLAHRIWPVAYSNILTLPQLSYMLEKLYSHSSLEKQINVLNHNFLIIEKDNIPVGFASYSEITPAGKYKLHKLYVLPAEQRNGLGKLLLDHVEEIIRSAGGSELYLNVNRHNKAISFYQKSGFKIIKEEDVDIGEGFFMNDYVMSKNLTND